MTGDQAIEEEEFRVKYINARECVINLCQLILELKAENSRLRDRITQLEEEEYYIPSQPH